MAIINGRQMEIPDSGVYGEDLIREAKPGSGRRAVLMARGGVQSIRADKLYSKKELIGMKNGKVKHMQIKTMPDRTKGSR